MRKASFPNGLEASAIGLGCSPMSYGYGPDERDDAESTRVIHRAVELGITLFDSADVYGPFTNEMLLGDALRSRRSDVLIATKCGLVSGPDGTLHRNGRPEYLRAACRASLQRLQTDVIDLYQLHRVDPSVPLAETWGALAELVVEGSVRALGISHATVEELELVHSIFPVSSVQYELSVMARRSRDELLPWCKRNGVGFLAFAPIGRGFLGGLIRASDVGRDDSRSHDPRFTPTAMQANAAIVEGLRKVAERHQATSAQVAIAWVMAQGDNVVPIPGTKRMRWLMENAAGAELSLTSDDLLDIDGLPEPVGEKSWDRARTVGDQQGSRRVRAAEGADA